MKIKSIKNLRNYFKTEIKKRYDSADARSITNADFAGVYVERNGKWINGFFELMHGHKEDIANFLRSFLEIAEDGQAVYEFLQNAADSGAKQFFIFYDEKYFLAINNGAPFNQSDVLSILNVSQTTKKDNCENIGRFGIGFKLVHRLVGKNDGIKELIEDYKGPIIFSWYNVNQLKELLKINDLKQLIEVPWKTIITPERVNPGDNLDNIDAPWLFKIIATNFPVEPGEEVFDINYRKNILFPFSELKEMVAYINKSLNTHKGRFDLTKLNQGSIFFLKLGEEKKALLDNEFNGLINGVQFSLNFLHNLRRVFINNDVLKKEPLTIKEFKISSKSELANEIQEIKKNRTHDGNKTICDITVKLGYTEYDMAESIRKSPNFYKFFPMGDEIHGFSFVIHSDSFDIEANRRKLHESKINKKLLNEIAALIVQYMNNLKINDRNEFLKLYANLLISEIPDEENNKWLQEVFYIKLLEYIRANIPVANGHVSGTQYVKIKNTKLDLNLSDLGLQDFHWFAWNRKNDAKLIKEALKPEKLGLEEWDIRDIIENADIESINNWIASIDENTYKIFLTELENSYLRDTTKNKIKQIKLFEFTDGEFYSIDEIIRKDIESKGNRGYYKYSYKKDNYFFKTSKLKGIANELSEIGIILSKINISLYPNIFSVTEMPDEKKLFDHINEKCRYNELSSDKKKNLFLNFINEDTKFQNVRKESLRKLQLFCDRNNVIQPLSRLISINFNKHNNFEIPEWLREYEIKENEYFPALDDYLVNDIKSLFEQIYEPNKEEIVQKIKSIKDLKTLIQLYNDNEKSFFEDYIIEKNGSEIMIIQRGHDTYQIYTQNEAVRKFIKKCCPENLFLLPDELEEYKNDEHIKKSETLYDLLLNTVDLEKHKDSLIDILKYKAKSDFLKRLDEYRFNANKNYSEDDYEYKLLKLATDRLNNNELSLKDFREKVIIETEQGELWLSEIPQFSDRITIGNYTLSLSKIFPGKYQNTSYLSDLINHFVELGLKRDLLQRLFGINDKTELENIFEMFSEQVETLENADQLAFVLLYNNFVENVDLKNFKVVTEDGSLFDLSYSYYIKPFYFLVESASFDERYDGLEKILKELPFKVEGGGYILNEPFFENNQFICPYIKQNDLSVEEKLSFVKFLYNKWKDEKNKEVIKKIDWSNIENNETMEILGFNPNASVFPNSYAYESEKLPGYLIDWIGTDQNKLRFLSDLGVWTEGSITVELRKFLSGKTDNFQNISIAQEARYNNHETPLFNTFLWLKENNVKLSNKKQFETFQKVVEIINENRQPDRELIIENEPDLDQLRKDSEEWNTSYYIIWKGEDKYSIYIYDGELPKKVMLDEIPDYVFFNYKEGNSAIDKENKIIYVNKNINIEKELKILEAGNEDLDFSDLWQDGFEILKKENEELKEKLAKYEQQIEIGSSSSAILGVTQSDDIPKSKQKEVNKEAKEIVIRELENLGFEIMEEVGEYSTLYANKNEIKYPIVIKSYQYQTKSFKIGVNELLHLLQENSMLLVHLGGGRVGNISFFELIKNQDKFFISFDTQNFEKKEKLKRLAETLKFFNAIHFNFNSLKPKDLIGEELIKYRFWERKLETDLSDDEDSLLE